jgi:hypothetical protein
MLLLLLAVSVWLVAHSIWFGFVKRRIEALGGEFTGSDAIARGVAGVVLGVGCGPIIIAMLLAP